MDITRGAIIDVIELPRNSRPLPLSCILFEPTKFCSVIILLVEKLAGTMSNRCTLALLPLQRWIIINKIRDSSFLAGESSPLPPKFDLPLKYFSFEG